MNILISNDDGYDALGIQTLISRLECDGHHLFVAAPATQQSAKSHSITLYDTLQCKRVKENHYKISGTPADCVLIAEKLLFKEEKIDLVISGINRGQNVGEDIYYSGTVAAAREGSFQGYKAIAISQMGFDATDFDLAAEFIAQAINNGLADFILEKEFLNINVPDISREQLQGVAVTCLGHREFVGFSRGKELEEGVIEFKFGLEDIVYQHDAGSDIEAVHEQKISITPIFANFANQCSMDKLREWRFLGEFN